MHPSHLNQHGLYEPPTPQLAGHTVIYDRANKRPVMRLQGVLVLPVGAKVQLVNPNVDATVTAVRLEAGNPMYVCLDVEVPAEYWGT